MRGWRWRWWWWSGWRWRRWWRWWRWWRRSGVRLRVRRVVEQVAVRHEGEAIRLPQADATREEHRHRPLEELERVLLLREARGARLEHVAHQRVVLGANLRSWREAVEKAEDAASARTSAVKEDVAAVESAVESAVEAEAEVSWREQHLGLQRSCRRHSHRPLEEGELLVAPREGAPDLLGRRTAPPRAGGTRGRDAAQSTRAGFGQGSGRRTADRCTAPKRSWRPSISRA